MSPSKSQKGYLNLESLSSERAMPIEGYRAGTHDRENRS